MSLGSEPLPLFYTGPGQIDAMIPWDAPTGVILPLTVTRQGFTSPVEPVVLAQSQPAVFLAPQVAPVQGTIIGLGGLAGPQAPVSTGDVVVIYCAGLGPVTPILPTGAAAPLDQLVHTVNPVTVAIGGMSAQVLFAGLAPGSVAEYQINAVIPAGVSPGESVPLVLNVAGVSSLPVTLAVK